MTDTINPNIKVILTPRKGGPAIIVEIECAKCGNRFVTFMTNFSMSLKCPNCGQGHQIKPREMRNDQNIIGGFF